MIIDCACGQVIRGASEQELLEAARRHIQDTHRDLGKPPETADLLAMAYDELPDAYPRTSLTPPTQRRKSNV